MSLLKEFKELQQRVIHLEEVLGASFSDHELEDSLAEEPWYLNIPPEGVICYTDDRETIVHSDVIGGSDFKHTILWFHNDEFLSRSIYSGEIVTWNYAIPVDPRLRLPNGQVHSQ